MPNINWGGHQLAQQRAAEAKTHPNPITLNKRHFVHSEVDMDHILKRLEQQISTYRCTNFYSFVNGRTDLCLRSKSNARPVFDLDGKWIGYDKYVYPIWEIRNGDKAPKDKDGKPRDSATIKVRISNSNDVVKVSYFGRWVSVSVYLSSLGYQQDSNYRDDDPQNQWTWQWQWWWQNGKTFPFLELPREIRDIIYEYNFGPVIEPYPSNKARRRGAAGALLRHNTAGIGLLRSRKQVKAEAAEILYLYTPFLVTTYRLVGPLLAHNFQRNHIRRLELAFSHEEFFKLFGLQISEDEGYKSHRSAHGLRSMKLNSLVLIIAPPAVKASIYVTDGACQTTVVDWILEAAWPHVRGHPVEIKGYVRKQQKEAFEAGCLVARKKWEHFKGMTEAIWTSSSTTDEVTMVAWDEWMEWIAEEDDGGVSLIERWETKKVEQKLVKREIPPQCWCPIPCTLDAWVPEL